ncbi:NAD-dependent epimerase/dehydratase family protein [Myxococcus llanfairpwllgwyngyllgogerychwyrndrobwllllantysiliogogogochensis]|uniref:NAD-dependent epimerase/dehydratase family protein n=1 Tax=Myxococcus llanfairpwllgwyngyllgogerychwyrndrobwllllantysiliogogogochensis TaxID=2590453 RepID=A0A540X8I1_9BACT|nr:NAD(P)H-binding protein [Myxococcus llanfairpwllgwyngyllgogerychwyrndrobwllllantysiliogogogochensis]TQF17611.1 NAD-dependent epimerase/dehydratase family protein [Myxococcus llanfairpwllgwyngyllgogerychwyrndrobwllllantysiliogogogochensis]
MKYLVTGATGNIGSGVTRCLLARGERPCVFVRDAKKARALFGDRVEVRVGDLSGSRASLSAALAGIDAVFLLSSGPKLGVWDRAFALAARAAGVKHLVKLSTLDVSTGVGTGPWHARGETAVRESGLSFTFIRSAAFMSNVLGWADSIASEGVLRSSTGEGKIAFIHPDDIAEVVTRALTTREYVGESLVITGPEALSYGEMATRIGATLGKTVRFEPISDEEAQADVGRGPYAAALVDIWRAVREGRMALVNEGVERVLGRRPLSFDRWVAQHAEAFR